MRIKLRIRMMNMIEDNTKNKEDEYEDNIKNKDEYEDNTKNKDEYEDNIKNKDGYEKET